MRERKPCESIAPADSCNMAVWERDNEPQACSAKLAL